MDAAPTPRRTTRGRRTRRAGAVCTITALMAVAVAACSEAKGSSEDSPASASSSEAASSPGANSQQQGQGSDISAERYDQLLKYSKCMRSHGVKKFPNPTKQGLSPVGVDIHSSQYQSAEQACKSLQPDGPHTGQSKQAGGGS